MQVKYIAPYVREIDPLSDLDFGDRLDCERARCGSRAEYIVGGGIPPEGNRRGYRGWALCRDHALRFAEMQKIPEGSLPEELRDKP